jgi:hypothetical protein
MAGRAAKKTEEAIYINSREATKALQLITKQSLTGRLLA